MTFRDLALLTTAITVIAGAAHAQPAALPELVVTAEKRATPLNDTPVAVAAFSGADLTNLGVVTLPEVAQFTPGVQVQDKKGGGLPGFIIRGVGLQDYNANNSPAAAIYIDDVYQPSNAMGQMALFDTDRVEILKGPQGGLYGRDTSGGAVQAITRHPEFGKTDGYLTAGYGSWGRWNVEGATDIPISDKVAIRISGLRESGDGGWQYSLTDNKSWGAPDRTIGRIQIRVAPTEKLDINLKLEAGWDGSQLPLARSVALYTRTGNFCAAALSGQRNDAGCFTLDQVNRTLVGLPPTPSAATQTSDGSTTLSHAFNQLENRNRSATLNMVYHLDGVDVTSVSNIDGFHYGQNYDFAASPDRLGLQRDRSDFTDWSQELRLTSTTAGPLSWLLGATYAEEDFRDDRSIDIRDNYIVQQSLGIPTVLASKSILQLGYNQDTHYGAVYGEAIYKLTDTVRVRGTLRYSGESRRYYDGQVAVSAPLLVELSGLTSDYHLGDHWSGKAEADWTPTPGVLTYVSISRGYKSGGIFGGFNQVAGQVTPYKEETVWAYEAGAKVQALHDHVQADVAVFHYDYRDVQGFTNVLLPSQIPGAAPVAYPVLTNLGDASHNGVELNAAWLPVTGLTLKGGVSWLNATYRNAISYISTDLISVSLDGEERPYAPKWSGFALARYETPLSSSFTLAGQLDYNFRSSETFPVTLVDKAVGAINGYGLSNARLTLTQVPMDVAMSVWVKNLANERYRVDVGSDGLGSYTEIYGEPRSWGVEVTKRW